eukprot:EG_transcript_8645
MSAGLLRCAALAAAAWLGLSSPFSATGGGPAQQLRTAPLRLFPAITHRPVALPTSTAAGTIRPNPPAMAMGRPPPPQQLATATPPGRPPSLAWVLAAVATAGVSILLGLLFGLRLPPGPSRRRLPPGPLRPLSTSSPEWCALAAAASPRQSARHKPSDVAPLPGEAPGSGSPVLMPNADVQDLLDGYFIDVQRVMRRWPSVVVSDAAQVERVTTYLAGLGVDVRRAVEKYPRLLGGRVEAFATVVQVLKDNGVDAVRVVNLYPDVLRRRAATLQRVMDAIVRCGLSAAEVAQRKPSIFQSSAAAISSLQALPKAPKQSGPLSPPVSPLGAADPRLTLLASLGLDADQLLQKAPNSVSLKFDKLQAVVEYLQGLGVDVPKLLRRNPRVLGRRPESIEQRVRFLSAHGLDAVRHLNGCPTLLQLDIERHLRPTVAFVTEEMGRPPADLDRASNLWTYDVAGRLRPRFLYLQSLGISPRSLSTFGSYSDECFVEYYTDSEDVQDYYAWRRRNGYPVPVASPDDTVGLTSTATNAPPALP